MKALIRSFESEWLKRRRSLASWLVVCGAFFTPAIVTVAKLVRHRGLAEAGASPKYWEGLWKSSWESMAIFLLPIGVILATSLITQLEYKNNAWKLLHTTPQSLATIFIAKLAVILVMVVQFLFLFNVGIYVSGVLPGLIFGVPYPAEPIPFARFLAEDARYLLACLPIVALQYLISLRARNFLVPVGCGMALWILSVAVLSWQYGGLIPYTYCSFNYLADQVRFRQTLPLDGLAAGYAGVFTVAAYVLYAGQREKG